MQITATKKLKSVLELPSLGIQISYDHNSDKGQTVTIDDKFFSNHDVQLASDLKFITISKVTKNKVVAKETGNEPTVRLLNKTNNPLLVPSDDGQKEIPANGSVVMGLSALQNPHILEAIDTKKIEVDKSAVTVKSEKMVPYDLDVPDSDQDLPADDTTAVVANPNQETTHETDQSMKKIDAKEEKRKEDVLKSEVQVYSPSDTVDANVEEKTDIEFVDKEQEQQRINAHPVLGKKVPDTVAVEAVTVDKFEETTPIVMKRSTKKTAAKKTTKKIAKRKRSRKKTVSKKPDEGKVFDIE